MKKTIVQLNVLLPAMAAKGIFNLVAAVQAGLIGS